MLCPACSGEIPEGAAFCPQCGAKATRDIVAAATPLTAPVQQSPLEPSPGLRGDAGRRNVPEQEVWSGSYSPKAMYGIWVAAALVTLAGIAAVAVWQNNAIGWSIFGLGVLVVWGGPMLSLVYRRMAVKYRLTTQRLFHESGILRRVTDRIETIDIDDVTFEQGIFERLFGVGTIRITSSDRTSPELIMPGIDNVQQVADKIDQARRAERQRRGMYIETV